MRGKDRKGGDAGDPVASPSARRATGAGFAVYVHWPFCLSRCPYCDFNSHVRETIDQRRWADAFAREIAWAAGEGLPGRDPGPVTSVFLGGGTPSLMDPGTVARVLHAIRAAWPVADDVEVTLEANPSSVEAAAFRGFRDAGVNRVSLGVQSFDDDALRFLGRRHDAAEARRAVETAADTFPRWSLDLIYARPGQTHAAWTRELADALSYEPGHLSAYQLTIEPGTAFFRERIEAMDAEPAGALFDVTRAVLGAAGLDAYEVSNHARRGAACRHNLTYWRGGPYAGIGPGAHGRLPGTDGTVATHQYARPETWLAAVEARGHGTAKRRTLGAAERRDEVVMMGLRLTAGLAERDFRAATGTGFAGAFDDAALARLVDGGFLERTDGVLRATDAGRVRLNAVLDHLLAPAGRGADRNPVS